MDDIEGSLGDRSRAPKQPASPWSSAIYQQVLEMRRYRCAIEPLRNRQAQGIADFLVASWQWIGLPRYLQMDNALEFRGANRYPRSFGRVVCVALALGIEAVFNSPGEPWRNGSVERHNGFRDERLLSVEFADFAALAKETHACQQACNQMHRLKALDGLTPEEYVANTQNQLLADDYKGYQATSLPKGRGFVSFIRLVRKSGRITLGAGDRFMIDPDLAYTYVLARVDLAEQQVVIAQNDEVICRYDFSADTVGAWADGNK